MQHASYESDQNVMKQRFDNPKCNGNLIQRMNFTAFSLVCKAEAVIERLLNEQ